MAKSSKVDSKEVGLVAMLNLFNFFLGTKDLHYGLWSDGLDVTPQNLPQAQKRYTDFLLEHIPGSVKSILDVGCGAGGLASEMVSRGFKVRGVSPSPLLTEAAQKQVGDDFYIYQGRFEDIEFPLNEKFDLVLFSESFQYIRLDSALEKAQSLLHQGGYILISDFFKTNAKGRSNIGGGHRFDRFMEVLEQSNLKVLIEKDITPETALNFDLVNKMEQDLLLPTMQLIGYTMKNNRPWIYRFLSWKLRNRLDKIKCKYVSGERNAQTFARYKIYKFFLLKI